MEPTNLEKDKERIIVTDGREVVTDIGGGTFDALLRVGAIEPPWTAAEIRPVDRGRAKAAPKAVKVARVREGGEPARKPGRKKKGEQASPPAAETK